MPGIMTRPAGFFGAGISAFFGLELREGIDDWDVRASTLYPESLALSKALVRQSGSLFFLGFFLGGGVRMNASSASL
jgi:hypothetical protein